MRTKKKINRKKRKKRKKRNKKNKRTLFDIVGRLRNLQKPKLKKKS